MKIKSKNRFAAVFLALAMLLTIIPFSPIGSTKAMAADNVYVLNASDLPLVKDKGGTFTDGQDPVAAGTENFFKIHVDSNTRFDGSNQKFDDDFAGTQRINFNSGTKTDSFVNSVEFTTANPATVKVWWRSGDVNRYVALFDQSGTEVAKTKAATEKNTVSYIDTFEVSAGGKYYLGNVDKSNYIFKIEVAEHAPVTYVLDASDLPLVKDKGGTFTDGQDPVAAGTENFFKIHVDSNTRFDGSNQKFDDGFAGTQRINFNSGTKTDSFVNSVEFEAAGPATVKVWWRSGDVNRYVALFNQSGTEVAKTKAATEKNTVSYIDTFEISDGGKYYLGNVDKSNYIFKIEVTVGAGEIVRGDWGTVGAPSISNAEQSGSKINVTVSALVGNDGGDEVVVEMKDSTGAVVETKRSLAAKSEHTLEFAPTASGTYSFKATLSRDGESDKSTVLDRTCDFVLPLGTPTIASATSMGGGSVELVWSAVPEADSYNVYCNGEKVGESVTTTYTVSDLTVGESYDFTVSAVRGDEEGKISDVFSATATAEQQRVWSYVYYGESASASNNGSDGSINEDGKVTVYSEGGSGKIVPGGLDGMSYYYTAIPDSLNFTLRANVHVDSWTYSNGQDGFGLLALDRIPELGQKGFWTNQYMLAASKMEYYWDTEAGKALFAATDSTVKYSMQLGIGVNTKSGITPELLPQVEAMVTDVVNVVAPKDQYMLENYAVGKEAGTYNIIGNTTDASKLKGESIKELTDFVFEIQRNNTGYFFTYYDLNGTVIGRQKFYDTKALSLLDKENVYVGFFAARNARATFSNVQLTTIAPADDAPAEEKPVELVTPNVSITSASVANSEDYTLMMNANVDGTAVISVNDVNVADGTLTAKELFSKALKLTRSGSNNIVVVFTPDPNQDLGEDRALSSTDPVTVEFTVKYNTKFADQKNLYVSPLGHNTGNGGPDYPLDIHTAVSVVQPGQTIIVMEGTYNLTSPVRIERGMDGTADALIRMIVDPNATSRPVFDFNKECEGFRLGGNYWFMQGFDVTNSANGLTGFRVCGSNNTLDQINAYNNGNTGIQISAYRDSNDPRELWPQNNLILNCTSYNNADSGYEDADGFAAKLTIGNGNVFDGCVAYNNADDGWDLYAKVSSGPIGTVVIRNCVAYRNGYLLDGTNAGNGNGFKMGGENLAGGHTLINSITFENKADGITSNSCPDVQVIGSTSFNNEKSNINLYTNNANNTTAFRVENFVSFKNDAASADAFKVADTFKLSTPDASTLGGEANYIWNGSKSVNSTGAEITADMFESLVFGGLERKADGTIDLKGFLKLNNTAPGSAGADFDKDGGSTSSGNVSDITPDDTLPQPGLPLNPTGPSASNGSGDDKSDPSEDDKSVEFDDNNKDTDIKVTAPEGAFDNADEIKFNADPVVEETGDNTFTFELNFTDKDGNKVQPKAAVTVKIPVPEALKGKTIYVYHVEDDGKYTEIDCKVVDGMVVFTASKFSKYIITSEKLTAAADPEDNSGSQPDSGTQSDPGSQSNPSTGVAAPIAGISIVLASAIAVCVIKRKRG